MRAAEFLNEEIVDEYSGMAHGIGVALKKKGYKFLGAGVDQAAYMEPGTGHVLKIFGTAEHDKFSRDHKMFFKWAKFCEQHQSNPFLPRFYGHESFLWSPEYDPEEKHRYLMIRTELLKDSGDVGRVLAHQASEVIEFGDPIGTVLRQIQEEQPIVYNKLVKQLGVDGIAQFFKTAQKLYQLGERSGYVWDLHGSNIMIRADGTPVINDPWVL